MTRKQAGIRGLEVLAGLAMVTAIAACGSSNSSSGQTSNASASPAASTTASSTSGAGVMISMAKGPLGDYLTGPSGRALYLFAADTTSKSSCSGACAKAWPPLTTSGSPGAASGVIASDVGTITRTDGTKQVTYKGHPLYYFAFDASKGTTKGQGYNNFGASWWLVSPAGSAITKTSAASSASSSSSGSSSSTTSSGGGGWG